MADDAPVDEAPASSDSSSGGPSPLTRKVGPLPVWGWFVAAAGVLGVFLLWRARQGTSSTSPLGGTPTVSGGPGVTQVDPLTGENLLTAIENLTTALQGSSGAGPNATGSGFFGTIRDRGGAPSWDALYGGIPMWNAPGTSGNWLALIPFGAQPQIIGVRQGPSNMGETTWYQVIWGGVTGWISAFDLAAFSGTPPPNFGFQMTPGSSPFNILPPPNGVAGGVPSIPTNILTATTAPPALMSHLQGAGLSLARTNVAGPGKLQA